MNSSLNHDIVTIPRADALQIYTTPGAINSYLDQVRVEIDAFVKLGMTIESEKGRKAIRSMAFRLARTRTALENVGKALADEVKAIPKKVDATRRQIRDTLDAWEEEVRAPLTAWEDAEKARVAAHEAGLVAIEQTASFLTEPGVHEVNGRIAYLDEVMARNWQEFAEKAATAEATARAALAARREAAVKREAEAAELARLREAEEKRAAAEREAAAKRAYEENVRRAAEAAAREAEERAARAEQDAREAEARAAREKAEAEEKARLAAEKAERDRVAAADAAAEAERRRQSEEKAREERAASAREADKKHRAKINNEAKDALVAGGLSDAAAIAAITAIARGEVPHVKISY